MAQPLSSDLIDEVARALKRDPETIPRPDENPEAWALVLEELRQEAPGVLRMVRKAQSLEADKQRRGINAARADLRSRFKQVFFRRVDGDLAPNKKMYLILMLLAATVFFVALIKYGADALNTAQQAKVRQETKPVVAAPTEATAAEAGEVSLASVVEDEGSPDVPLPQAEPPTMAEQEEGAGEVSVEPPEDLPRPPLPPAGPAPVVGAEDYYGVPADAPAPRAGFGGVIYEAPSPAAPLGSTPLARASATTGMVLTEQDNGGLGEVPLANLP